MSIRMLARDLYRQQKEVQRLEAELANAQGDRRTEIAAKLRQAGALLKQLKQALDGQIGRSRL